MEKMKVFLDSSVIISYFRDERDVAKLFSKRVLEKVQFVINPIVYQEIILVMNRIDYKIDLEELGDFVKVVQIDKTKKDAYLEKMRELRNLMVHTNDILVLQSAMSESDYLLTLDNQLLEIGEIDSLRILSPSAFWDLLEGRQ